MVKFILVAAEREVMTINKVITIVIFQVDRVSWLLLCRRMKGGESDSGGNTTGLDNQLSTACSPHLYTSSSTHGWAIGG